MYPTDSYDSYTASSNGSRNGVTTMY